MSIEAVVKSIQNKMRQDAGVDGDAQRIAQIVWMIFLKIFDDKEKEYELIDSNYRSPIPEELRWRNWAADDEGITGEGLLEFINNKLFKTLKDLSFGLKDDPRGFIVKEVFEDAYNYMKSGTLIRQVINKINQIDFKRSQDRHIFNDVYETFLKDLQSAGNAGELYTPRPVTQFMVEMVDPQLGEKVLDPACGTGGFLVNTLEHVNNNYVKTAQDFEILQKSIWGIEKKPLPHLLCITNMILHGIETPHQIRRDNMLSKPLFNYTEKDRVDVIVTNPPFGGTEKDEVPSNFPATFRTKETADLFLVLIMQLLKQGGRGAIVLPDGSLSGENVKERIRSEFLNKCNLHTIIRMPNSVFKPYATVKTNLLFFTKGEPTNDVWYFEHPYPEGVKSYSKTKPLRLEEFVLEKQWWTNREESQYSWKASISDLQRNGLNLDIKNPMAINNDLSISPKLIIRNLRKQQNIVSKIIEKIGKIVNEEKGT